MSAISASPVEPAILPFGSLEWFKRELSPTAARARRTAIMVAAAVLCVIISMTLQVPELSVTAYMPFFMSGIHTALITCTFIALESTEATMYKGTLRFVGCLIGGALALFSIVFLMPHMKAIASLVVLVACAAAIAGWVATGSQRISYAGLQLAFAFFYSVFRGYAPDTDLDNVRNRVVGILFGLIVTGLVFQYIWPERARIESQSSK
jgi:multidrug resistance protein MdtO